MIDYKRKVIQLTSLNDLAASPQLFGRRLMSFQENNTTNGTRINATKIVIQDYNTVSFNIMPTCLRVVAEKTKNQSQTNKKEIPILSNVRDNKNQGYRVQKKILLKSAVCFQQVFFSRRWFIFPCSARYSLHHRFFFTIIFFALTLICPSPSKLWIKAPGTGTLANKKIYQFKTKTIKAASLQ